MSTLTHIWTDTGNGPRILCGIRMDEATAAVSAANLQVPMLEVVCSVCLRVLAKEFEDKHTGQGVEPG